MWLSLFSYWFFFDFFRLRLIHLNLTQELVVLQKITIISSARALNIKTHFSDVIIFYAEWWRYYKFKCFSPPSIECAEEQENCRKLFPHTEFNFHFRMTMIRSEEECEHGDKWDSMPKEIMGNLHCNAMGAGDLLHVCVFNQIRIRYARGKR